MTSECVPNLKEPGISLYLIPVPISSDTPPDRILPLASLEIVNHTDCFFVENIRSARRFIKAVDKERNIDSIEFHVLNEHTTEVEADNLLKILLTTKSAAVISEAGCPSIADPGAKIVERARCHGVNIIPLVGPSSIILGLMASGFNGQNFAFNGYLPYDTSERKRAIKEYVRRIHNENQTQIFIETPYRNNKLINELANDLPAELKLCVACDLTSQNETVIVKRMAEWRRAEYDFNKRPAIFLLAQ